MSRKQAVFAVLSCAIILFVSGCASDQLISQEEMRIQDAAAAEVANILFDKQLDNLASYNVRPDGYVHIKFDQSVPFVVYNDVVQILRSKKTISAVYAEQGGVQVCGRPF